MFSTPYGNALFPCWYLEQVSLVKRLMSRHTMGTPGLMGKDVTTIIVKAHIITHNYMQSETNTALIH